MLWDPISHLDGNAFSIVWVHCIVWGFPGGSTSKESTCNAGDLHPNHTLSSTSSWAMKSEYFPVFSSCSHFNILVICSISLFGSLSLSTEISSSPCKWVSQCVREYFIILSSAQAHPSLFCQWPWCPWSNNGTQALHLLSHWQLCQEGLADVSTNQVESESGSLSRSVVSNSLRPHGL